MKLFIPPLSIADKIGKHYLRQLLAEGYHGEHEVTPYTNQQTKGFLLKSEVEELLVVTQGNSITDDFTKVLRIKNYNGKPLNSVFIPENYQISWIRHPKKWNGTPKDYFSPNTVVSVIQSWKYRFLYKEESKSDPGLRPPQLGAIHAALSHWSIAKDPATIILPTGVGKTETMLSLLLAKPCTKVLVVVPFDALRGQTFNKFYSLGILKELGIVSTAASFPIVGLMLNKPKTVQEADDFFSRSNVVITTMAIAAGLPGDIQAKMASLVSHLFIDEAHHIAAPTWEGFKDSFRNNPILQFTATPFRNDKKPVAGKVIYNYPLAKAQEDGYFKPIQFDPVLETNPVRADEKIAEKAVTKLREDLDVHKYDHILMARVNTIDRADEIFPLYAQHGDLNPVIVHSKLPNSKRIVEAIKRDEHRIIVCVDMLGEGFDLPKLKVAAIHDNHKSLGITLQFAGRFTRSSSSSKIGDAYFVANVADPGVEESLEDLFSLEPNWSKILSIRSSEQIEKTVRLSEMIQGFEKVPDTIPLQNLLPKLSTVVYQMTPNAKWKPEEYTSFFKKDEIFYADINRTENIILIVTKSTTTVDWGRIKGLNNTIYDLYLIYWNEETNLLYLNSSDNSSLFRELAEKIGGSVALLEGDTVFRCFHNINRIILQNVGLRYSLDGPMRYVMYTGIDVTEGLTLTHVRNKIKSNVFGIGYENGKKITVGCSYKGRIWCRNYGDLSVFKDWCNEQGKKLLDTSLNGDDILTGALIPSVIKQRPELVPLTIEWSDNILSEPETRFSIIFDQEIIPLSEVDIRITDYSVTGNLKFVIFSELHRVEYELVIYEEDGIAKYRYERKSLTTVYIQSGSRNKTVEQWFDDNPPKIRFEDTSFVENNIHVSPGRFDPGLFDQNKILGWDWTGTNIKIESQEFGTIRKDSIQYRVIQDLPKDKYSIIFNDDNPGEAADVIAIKLVDKKIWVELYHCKYSGEPYPGARVGDLYEVCGQAQKSVQWKEHIKYLFNHIRTREKNKQKATGFSRFMHGDLAVLIDLEKQARFLDFDYKIFIVQPGLSKPRTSEEQVDLLAATQYYLRETYNIDLTVIANKD